MRAVRYIAGARKGQVKQHSSHNPLGTLMVYALWSCLAVIIASGIAMAGPPPANPNVREVGEANEAASSEVRSYSEEEGEQEREEQERGESGEGGEEVLEEVHDADIDLLNAEHLHDLQPEMTAHEVAVSFIPHQRVEVVVLH